MSQSTKTALAVVGIVAMAAAFWLLLLSPKRDKAAELSTQVSAAKTTLSTETQRAEVGLAAKKKFRRDYQQLILLGKAVPASEETASLMVQLNSLARPGKTPFVSIAAGGGPSGSTESTTEPSPTIDAEPPLGSTVGPAGFRAMPSELEYSGGYYNLVEVLKHLNGLVTTKHGRVVTNGRLITIDNFSLLPQGLYYGFNRVVGEFNVTSYTTPSGQGLTAGASPLGPGTTTESASQ